MKRIARIAALIGAATMIVPATAGAEDYPARPIRVLTTTSAGGISDIFMRALGEELRQRLGQPLVVENRPGGMQNVGARACTEAPPDGYTICILNADPLVYNQFLLKNMPFDPEKGLAPITNLFHLIQTLTKAPDTAGQTLPQNRDFVRRGRHFWPVCPDVSGHAWTGPPCYPYATRRRVA
jgi:tripartite-type tricarboxylate transporter receptor subunit TctC